MREIKFRAWDEQKKVMHFNFQFFTSGDEGNDWICFSSDKEPRDIGTVPQGILFKNPYFRQQLKIMQFTGLRDKNGREIYEGDIVFEDSRKITAEVMWRPESCSFQRRPVEKRAARILWELWPIDQEGYEVIGNRWENPELVK